MDNGINSEDNRGNEIFKRSAQMSGATKANTALPVFRN